MAVAFVLLYRFCSYFSLHRSISPIVSGNAEPEPRIVVLRAGIEPSSIIHRGDCCAFTAIVTD
jgi:hypothetical protein